MHKGVSKKYYEKNTVNFIILGCDTRIFELKSKTTTKKEYYTCVVLFMTFFTILLKYVEKHR